jgi:hypothetical protein
MAVTHGDVQYNPVPINPSTDGSGASPMGIHANPDEFGAQVGEATQKAGAEGVDIALKQQGLLNETLMTNADANFAKDVGAIKADYMTKTGLAAHAAYPAYQQAIQDAYVKNGSGLNQEALHGYQTLGARTMINHIAEGAGYAASQLKEGAIDSATNAKNVYMQQILDPSVAASDSAFHYNLGTIKHLTTAQMDSDSPGLKTDPDTGVVSFDESTPAGQKAKADFQQNLDTSIGSAYINRYDTLSKSDPLGAFAKYQQERNDIPKAAQAALDISFVPKVFNAHAQGITANAISTAEQEHAKIFYNPQPERSPLDVIRDNEGYTGKIGRDSNGANVINGINEKAFPTEYAEAKNLLDTKGKAAADAYADNFYQKNIIDKYDINSLPQKTQAIVADGLVNHGTGTFGQSLVDAAKNGASPQQLIDMRRTEYQRLADSDTDGSKGYASSLRGWDARLDKFQTAAVGNSSKSYATNPDGSPLTQADYYRTHSQDVYAKGDAYAESVMPGDLAMKRAVRLSLDNYMNKAITNQSAQYMMDNKNVMRAINGELTKGQSPETEEEMRMIPGMSGLLDKVAIQDPKFAEGIPTMIAKNARRNDVTNSSNAFETITRTLQPQDDMHPNHIKNQNQLDSLLGKTDSTGINMKDYNDAKPATELDPIIKEPILQHMQQIANANGNIDGKGQQRAVQWYNQVMKSYKQKPADMDDATFASHIGEPEGPLFAPPSPSRMTQISNWAKEVTGLGHVLVTNPDGQRGYMPAANVEKALAAGYKKVE